jgi:hypothetical protein
MLLIMQYIFLIQHLGWLIRFDWHKFFGTASPHLQSGSGQKRGLIQIDTFWSEKKVLAMSISNVTNVGL